MNRRTIAEPEEPTPPGHVRIYAIQGYVDQDQLWAGALDEAGDYEWWRTNRPTKVVDVPRELLERYERAEKEWEAAEAALAAACGIGLATP